jgi:hypothetical protein
MNVSFDSIDLRCGLVTSKLAKYENAPAVFEVISFVLVISVFIH